MEPSIGPDQLLQLGHATRSGIAALWLAGQGFRAQPPLREALQERPAGGLISAVRNGKFHQIPRVFGAAVSIPEAPPGQ